MATLTPTLTLASTDISASEALSLSVTDSLAVAGGSINFQSIMGNRLHTTIAAAANFSKSYVFLKNLSTTAIEIITITHAAFTDATVDYNNDPTIVMDVSGNVKAGMNVYHGVEVDHIPIGATIASVTDATDFELSAATTDGSNSNQTITFANGLMTLGAGEFAFFPWSAAFDIGGNSASGTPTLEVRIFQAAS